MTTVETSISPSTDKRQAWTRARKDLGNHVAKTVAGLQTRLLLDVPHPEVVGVLARLRRGIGRMPGFDYTLEQYLALPNTLLGKRPADDAEASDAECAAHDSITHYALHQQSKRERMHVGGQGFGRCMAELIHASNSPDGVRRRFAALGTATTYRESIYHLRSLIVMLREHSIPLDYGLLADDLNSLRSPEGRPATQAAWGREFFRSRPGAESDNREEENPS